MVKKRDLSIFESIEELESQDLKADRKRQKKNVDDHRRAKEVQSQTKIYNQLVEARILMQRAIVSGYKSNAVVAALDEDSSDRQAPAATEFRETCNSLLEKLLIARCQLIGGTKAEEGVYGHLLKSKDSSTLHETLQSEYELHRKQWKQTLNQRQQSLRLHSGITAKSQFRVMDSSFWEQVDATVEFEEMRNRHTNDESSNQTTGIDDSKVYHQLLKDFVANSTHITTGDGTTTTDRLRALQRKQSSENKQNNVDRRASKGRKIRYKEIPKLVNFTFPLSRPNLSSLSQDEYFQSLFGGAGNKRK